MELIPSHALQLAQKLVMLHHMPDGCTHEPHWKQTTNTHLVNIANLVRLKGNKLLSPKDVRCVVFDEPIGEYRDYLFHHENVKFVKKEMKFSAPSQLDYDAIKRKYDDIIFTINSGEIPRI